MIVLLQELFVFLFFTNGILSSHGILRKLKQPYDPIADENFDDDTAKPAWMSGARNGRPSVASANNLEGQRPFSSSYRSKLFPHTEETMN